MDSLYLLIPVSLLFCFIAIAIFFWAVNNGQYEDLDGEGERVLFDEAETGLTKQAKSSSQPEGENTAGLTEENQRASQDHKKS